MKLCRICNIEKPEEAFNWRNKSKNKRHSTCTECHKAYTRNHYKSNASRYKARAHKYRPRSREIFKQYVLDYLLTHPCVDCGEADVEVLQFDHVELVGNAAKRVSHCTTKTSFDKEASKCEVRCANCHVRRTRKQLGSFRIKE